MYPSMVDMDAVVLNRQLWFDNSVAARRRFAIAGASPKEQRGGCVCIASRRSAAVRSFWHCRTGLSCA